MKLEINTLIENSCGEHLKLICEHGLSFFIQAGDTTLLFDTGASSEFIKNAELMSLDLTKINKVVISHGHYDHSGGYPALLDKIKTSNPSLVVKPGFFDKKYGANLLSSEYLGNGFTKKDITDKGIDIETINEDIKEIAPNVFSVSGFVRNCPLEKNDPRFRVVRNGKEVIDDFRDEHSLVIKSDKGLVVILGCSHPGLINMLSTIKTHFKEKIYSIIGGTHLVAADQERLEKTMDYILDIDVPVVGISHCSGGTDHIEYIKSRLKHRFFHNNTGTRFVV